MSPRWSALRWAPFACGLVWLGVAGLAGALRLDLPHLLGAGLVGVTWLLGRGLWGPALLFAVLLAPVGWHLGRALPAAEELLAPRPAYLRVEGTVRARAQVPGREPAAVRLLLGDVVLWAGARRAELAEAAVELPARSPWPFRYRSRLRIGGAPRRIAREDGRLAITLRTAAHYTRVAPTDARRGEALQLHLRDRAAYYLSPTALATYLPVLLGRRERDTPEARDVLGAFRRAGVAHLFAISGLHVGLLYLLFAGALHWGLSWLQRGQEVRGSPGLRRAAVLVAIWGYIALIGFPIPAVRAAAMGTLLVWNEQWGTRTPPLYVLALTALGFLAWEPSQLYDLSFQLSFLAYFFLLAALAMRPPTLGARIEGGWSRWRATVVEGAITSLWLTTFITAGLWPVTTTAFGKLSLLVFVGNLLLVPLLGLVVLPVGLIALLTSALQLGAPPGAWGERIAFGAAELALQGWAGIALALERLGGAAVLQVEPAWSARAFFLYYAVLLAALGWGLHRRRRHAPRAARTGPPAGGRGR